MTAVQAERPSVSVKDPIEWQIERAAYTGSGSSDWLDGFRQFNKNMHGRNRRQIQLEREAREREDREQEAQRDAIYAENEQEADRIRESACPTCFCVHPGECF